MTRQIVETIRWTLAVVIACEMSVPTTSGAALHVPGEYATIQAAIDATTNGDVVEIADGTYKGVGNKNLDFEGRAITVRSASGKPALCIIDCEHSGRGFYFHSGEGPDSVVDGVTVTSAYVGNESTGGGYGGAVRCSTSSPTIANCVFRGNSASQGGAVYCQLSNPLLINCILRDNWGTSNGAGLCCSTSSPTLINCTIIGNTSRSFGGGVYCVYECDPILTNCILRGNSPQQYYHYSGTPLITYSNIEGGWAGTGNIDADPLFAFEGDVHLMSGSPCIDAGTNGPSGGLPSIDLDGNARSLDGDGDLAATADMGAYEFDPQAPGIALSSSKVEFLAPAGGIDPSDRPLFLRNCGGGTLNWTVAGLPAWLTVLPNAGTSNGESVDVTLSADISGMPYGEYVAVLEIVDPQASNSPHRVTVALFLSATIRVPTEYPTIQEAIDAAIPGDVVEIEHGTYSGAGNKDLDFRGKQLIVKGVSGDATQCVIDCEGEGRGFYFHGGEGSDSRVEGLTISNGGPDATSPMGSHGGGVYVGRAGPTLRNCTIRQCTSAYWNALGGGVCCGFGSSPTLIACSISGNAVPEFNGSGGGVYAAAGTTLIDCSITDNWAWDRGGGVYCGATDVIISGCTLSRNSAGTGGGVYGYGIDPIVTNCMITANLAASGGGVSCQRGNMVLLDCVIHDNRANYGGGGLDFAWGGSPVLFNCTIRGNIATWAGGLLCEGDVAPTLTNCTITGNHASAEGGGVRCVYDGAPVLTNCILWDNAPDEINVLSASPTVTYCDVQGGWTGAANIDADPRFAFANDVRLMSDSPCIDAGSNNPPSGLPPEDAEGKPRLVDGDGDAVATVDMGAYEFDSTVPTIAADVVELEFVAPVGGNAPGDQFLLLRNCGGGTLNWEVTGQPFWMTVMPSTGDSSGEVDQLMLQVDNSALAHGALAAVLKISDPQAANSPREVTVRIHSTSTLAVPAQFPTIQSAVDAAVPGDVVELADGVHAGPGNKDIEMDGKAITIRSASGDPDYCIIDCGYEGRGFHFHSGEGSGSILEGLTIMNGQVEEDDGGGGIYCNRHSSPTIINCAIRKNTAGWGGGVACEGSRPTLINCLLVANSASRSGYTAATGGGLYSGSRSNPTLRNCTISENTTIAGHGGGVYSYFGDAALSNCIVWNNAPEDIFVDDSTPLITYSNVMGGWTGVGNIDADPRFLDPDGADNAPDTWEDNDYRLAPSSPCIDAGTNGEVTSTIDLDGHPRIVDGQWDRNAIVDMGPYEFTPADLDGNGAVNMVDYSLWADCLAGPVSSYPVACDLADLDSDGDVDLGDFARLARVMGCSQRRDFGYSMY